MFAGYSLVSILLMIIDTNGGANHDMYTGYTVHKIEIRDRADVELIHNMEQELNFHVWQYGHPLQRDAVIMVSPENNIQFLERLDDNGLNHYVHISDVAKHLEDTDAEIARHRRSRNGRVIPFEDYPRFTEINDYLERIAAEHPDVVTLVEAGPSYEKRPIKYVKISTTNFESNSNKPIIFIDAMLHGWEWVTTPMALYTIHRLVENLRKSDRDLLDEIDWIVLPIVNPDGYEYTHTTDRLFRRTRSPNRWTEETGCYGVDANRNFNVSFNTIGVSNNTCALNYPGEEPFSEPETRYVRDIIHQHIDRIQMYLDIHSFGNWILYGYGDETLPPNALHLHFVGSAMGAAIDTMKLPKADYYAIGNSGSLLYETSGTAQDYAQIVGVPLSYTLELPGYEYWFLVPPQYISQINEETWKGLTVAARLTKQLYRTRTSV